MGQEKDKLAMYNNGKKHNWNRLKLNADGIDLLTNISGLNPILCLDKFLSNFWFFDHARYWSHSIMLLTGSYNKIYPTWYSVNYGTKLDDRYLAAPILQQLHGSPKFLN